MCTRSKVKAEGHDERVPMKARLVVEAAFIYNYCCFKTLTWPRSSTSLSYIPTRLYSIPRRRDLSLSKPYLAVCSILTLLESLFLPLFFATPCPLRNETFSASFASGIGERLGGCNRYVSRWKYSHPRGVKFKIENCKILRKMSFNFNLLASSEILCFG